MKDITERFLTYVAIDTPVQGQPDPVPLHRKQKDLLRLLAEEMKAMGISDVSIDEYGYVYGSIPSNMDKKVPAIRLYSPTRTRWKTCPAMTLNTAL